MRVSPLGVVLILMVLGAGCSRDDAPAATAGSDRPKAATASPSGSAAAALDAPTTGGPSAAPTASAAARAPASFEGTWEGSYQAKKGSVGLPSGVKDKTYTKDDGKLAIGSGSVTLTVDAKGEISGKSKGALGEAILTGKVEGEAVRASFMPVDPTRSDAMTGVLVGLLKGDVIKAEIRVAGPDASVVREAPIELKRK